jgi:hypothetical protein
MFVCVLLGDLTFAVHHSLDLKSGWCEIGARRGKKYSYIRSSGIAPTCPSVASYQSSQVSPASPSAGPLEDSTLSRRNLWDRLVSAHDSGTKMKYVVESDRKEIDPSSGECTHGPFKPRLPLHTGSLIAARSRYSERKLFLSLEL